MKFAEPIWLLAGLIVCGALVWAWRRYDARQRAALATFASSHLHAQLTASFSAAKRHWKRGLLLAAVGCLFLALAPRYVASTALLWPRKEVIAPQTCSRLEVG